VTSRRISSIFRSGSRTYFYSSIFFPPDVREDVFTLYAFVRTADDFVDQVPQDIQGFERFVALYQKAVNGHFTGNEVVDGFAQLSRRKGFRSEWTESFIAAMRQDLHVKEYETVSDVQGYMYGSAEVIGLFMARIFGLPEDAHFTARRLGTAMQYVNFLRDVGEDYGLGRTYIPQEVLKQFGMAGDLRDWAKVQPEGFAAMMRNEVQRYKKWQAEAEQGYRFLPSRYRVPIQTAADMYDWTARKIDENPSIVLERTLRPSVPRIVLQLVRNSVRVAA
jgi:phytoene synthase